MPAFQVGANLDERLIRTLVVAAVVAAGYLLVARLGRRGLLRLVGRDGDMARTARADTLWSIIRRMLAAAVTIVVVLEAAAIWGLSITPFLAVGSAIVVAVGLGAQTLVKDVIAGFFILAEGQFHIGDMVTVVDVTGEVIDVRPRVTVLRDVDGNVHYVPNGAITVASNLIRE